MLLWSLHAFTIERDVSSTVENGKKNPLCVKIVRVVSGSQICIINSKGYGS